MTERTGVRERRYKRPYEDASDMAVRAAERALAQAGTSIGEIDLIIFASSSQDIVGAGDVTPRQPQARRGRDGVRHQECVQLVYERHAGRRWARPHRAVREGAGVHRRGAERGDPLGGPELGAHENVVRWLHVRYAGAAMVLEARSDGTGIRYLDFRAASRHWEV